MPIRIQCPSPDCGATCKANESLSGRQVRCPKCGKSYLATPTLDGRSGDTGRGGLASADNPFPALPAEFGRYRVLRLLGQGGMGAVYVAHDTELDREVALKLPFFGPGDSSHRAERFVREARAAAALQHPSICTVFDAGRIDGRAFLTMALIEGTTLDALIDPDKLLDQARAATIVRDIARALEVAHRKGVVHRDLKPSNVMLKADGTPVVMDFGLAKRAADADPREAKLTRDGGVIGTPSYMSPEQVRGEVSAIGSASDVYSLGVILFELLTGHVPYTGSLGSVMGQILSAPIPPLRELRADADERLDAVCRTAMAKESASRFPSMAAMAEALSAYLVPASTPEEEVDVVLSEPAPAVATAHPRFPFDDLVTGASSESPRPKRKREDSKVTEVPTSHRSPRQPFWKRPAVVALAVLVPLAVIAAVVLRVETPNGMLVVEIDDPAVEARVKNGKLILSGPDGKDRYTLTAADRDKKIEAGQYKVRVEGADGLVLDTSEFTLKKGDKVTVRVTIDPKVISKKEAPGGKKEPASPTSDPNRRAAEYVLSVGGAVRVSGDGRDIRNSTELPREPFTLTGIWLADNQRVSDAGLAAFKDWNGTDLTHLDLWATGVSDRGLAYFKDCRKLTVIKLRGARISDEGLAPFGGCKDLAELWLSDTTVGDRGLSNFKDHTKLTTLDLEGTKVTDDGLAHFEGCRNLTFLILRNTQVGDVGFAHFKGCKNLEHLWAGRTRLSDTGLAQFKGCNDLKSLDVRETKVTKAGVGELRKAHPKCQISTSPGLDPDRSAAEYVLSVGGQLFIGDDFRHVPDAAALPSETFRVTAVVLSRNPKVNDEGLAAFEGCKHVRKLELFETGPVTDAGLAHFKECTELEELHIQHQDRIGDKGLANFEGFKKFRVLWLHKTKVTDTGLGYLKNSAGLEYLALPGTDVTDAGVAHFKGCKQITTLSLGGTKVTDAGLANFNQCKRFDCLALDGLAVSDTGLAHFKGCEVEVLLLEGCSKVTDGGLAQMGYTNTLRAWIGGTQATDKTLDRLAKSSRLADVRVERTKVSATGVEALKKAHPGCAVLWDASQK